MGTAQPEHQSFGRIESAHVSESIDSRRLVQANTASTLPGERPERTQAVVPPLPLPAPMPAPVQLAQGEGTSVGTTAPAYFDALVTANAEARGTEVARVNSAVDIPRLPASPAPSTQRLGHWVQQLDVRLRPYGGLASLGSLVDRLRYEYLRNACVIGDVFYVALHQLICNWTLQPAVVALSLPNVPTKVREASMYMLQTVLPPNHGLTVEHLLWLAAFPLPPFELAARFQGDISRFLMAFVKHWKGLVDSFRRRQVPLTASELVTLLSCRSKILQGYLFAFSLRVMEIPVEKTAALNALFAEEQRSEEAIALTRDLPPDDIWRARRGFSLRYLILVDPARHMPLAGEPGQNTRSQHVVPHVAHANLPLDMVMQSPAVGIPVPGQTPVNLVNRSMASPGVNNGRYGLATSAVAGQQEGNRSNTHVNQQLQNSASAQYNSRSEATRALPMAMASQANLTANVQGRPASFHPQGQHSCYAPPPGQNGPQNQVQRVPSQPLMASQMHLPAHRSALVAGNQPSRHPMDQQTSQREYNAGTCDWTSGSNTAHLPQLRSPKRQPAGSPITLSRHYQYLVSFAVKPTRLPPLLGLRQFEFTLSKTDLDKIPLTSMDNLTEMPICYYFDGSHRYRLRLCMRPETETEVKEGDWAMSPSYWPAEFYPSINDMPLLLPRKESLGRDQPVDITSHIVEGKNTIKVSFSKWTGNPPGQMTLFMAVEVVVTHRHESVWSMVQSFGQTPVGDTQGEIAKRLAPGDSDDVTVEDKSLTISITDPFSFTMFKIPVRGLDCKHLECFDLDIWLSTRKGKPSKVNGQEPSLADKWGCPICGLDARPTSLRIDGFLSQVRTELLATGKEQTKRIQVSADGRWAAVEEADDPSDSGDEPDEGPLRKRSRTSRTSTATPAIVEILDD